MDAMEKRVLRRKSGIISEVVLLGEPMAQDALRQGILRERDLLKVMTRLRNKERVLLFLQLLEKIRLAAFEKFCYFLENHGYSWLCDELLVELICEKGHLKIDASVLVEARAIVRQRLGEKKRLDEEDIEELTQLIATRYQIAKATNELQRKRPRRQRPLDVKSVKENVKDLCEELERCMLLSRGPSRVGSRIDTRTPRYNAASSYSTPRAGSSIGHVHEPSEKGIDSWIHGLKQKLYKLTSAYKEAAAVIESSEGDTNSRSDLSSNTVTSMGDIDAAAYDKIGATVRFQTGDQQKESCQKQAGRPPSKRSTGSRVEKPHSGYFRKMDLAKPPPLVGKPPKGKSESSKSDSKSQKSKSVKSTSSKESSKSKKKLSRKGSKSGSENGGEVADPLDVGDNTDPRQPELKGQRRTRVGFKGRTGKLDIENLDDDESVNSYSQIPVNHSAKGRTAEEIRTEQRQLLKNRKHITNIRRIMQNLGECGKDIADTGRMEEQYWQRRYDTMKKSQSLGYYFFLSEHTRDRCGACHSACSVRNPNKWDCAWWQNDARVVPFSKERTDLNLYDSSFGLGEDDSDVASLFDDEDCPGAIEIPGSQKPRCLACAYANKAVPEFFNAAVSPHGNHHFHFPQIKSKADKPKSGKCRAKFKGPGSVSSVGSASSAGTLRNQAVEAV